MTESSSATPAGTAHPETAATPPLPPGTAALYVGQGRTLSHYALDADSCTLGERGELALPNTIQSGWPHPHLPVLYISCGSPPPGDDAGDWVCAIRLDPDTGAPSLLGPPTEIASRALHLTTDHSGAHVLLAHTRPAGLSVLRTDETGAIIGPVAQRPDLDVGVFPHQVRLTPDDRFCLCVSRGLPNPHEWNAKHEAQTAPGSVRAFAYQDGVIGTASSIGPEDGSHFGPRNLDFDPTGAWFYLLLETQNEILSYRAEADEVFTAVQQQRFSTLAHPAAQVHQGAGPILFHPDRSVVYVANRAYVPGAGDPDSRIITDQGENSIVVYAADPATGRLAEIQRIDSGGTCPRSVSLDPTGTMLVVANSETYRVGAGDSVERVPMNLTTFRVLTDGRFELAHRYEIGDGSGPAIAWSGIATYS